MAVYNTEKQTESGGWQKDEDIAFGADANLNVTLVNRNVAVPGGGEPKEGITVTWDDPTGGGKVTFHDGGARFDGTASFPGEGPVGYRGRRAD